MKRVLTHWELLKNWINERIGDFRLLSLVRTEAAEWERNDGPRPIYGRTNVCKKSMTCNKSLNLSFLKAFVRSSGPKPNDWWKN